MKVLPVTLGRLHVRREAKQERKSFSSYLMEESANLTSNPYKCCEDGIIRKDGTNPKR